MPNHKKMFAYLNDLSLKKRVKEINKIRKALHYYSPFKKEPVDCVLWIESEKIQANDYNPNTVAPPEMELLKHSILEDGYTQPIVSWQNNGHYEVVDGFHRNRVGREIPEVKERIKGYLPLTIVNDDRLDRGDRIAATVRHNRARGKHKVNAMADIVVELKRRNWSEEKIAKNLGMDADEVLRLARVSGANGMALYVEENGNVTGYNKISKPAGHTWKSFCQLLLSTLPKSSRDRFLERFRVFVRGWRGRGYIDGIPDEAPAVLENAHWAPSYRRLCKVLLRKCKGLGLTQPKSEAYEKYMQIKKEKQNADAV